MHTILLEFNTTPYDRNFHLDISRNISFTGKSLPGLLVKIFDKLIGPFQYLVVYLLARGETSILVWLILKYAIDLFGRLFFRSISLMSVMYACNWHDKFTFNGTNKFYNYSALESSIWNGFPRQNLIQCEHCGFPSDAFFPFFETSWTFK